AGRGYGLKPPKPSERCEVVMARCETCGNEYDKASDTASKRTAPSFAASIARKPLASPACAIGAARRRDRDRNLEPAQVVAASVELDWFLIGPAHSDITPQNNSQTK